MILIVSHLWPIHFKWDAKKIPNLCSGLYIMLTEMLFHSLCLFHSQHMWYSPAGQENCCWVRLYSGWYNPQRTPGRTDSLRLIRDQWVSACLSLPTEPLVQHCCSTRWCVVVYNDMTEKSCLLYGLLCSEIPLNINFVTPDLKSSSWEQQYAITCYAV